MELKPDFAFRPQPPIPQPPPLPQPMAVSPMPVVHPEPVPAPAPVMAPVPPAPVHPAPVPPPVPLGSPLGHLSELVGTWTGTGFNVIWRPNNTRGQDRFLELNKTIETIEFVEIPGEIPNRGLLQPDIVMFGLRYLQQIKDANTNAGLHIEPGIWASVPLTTNPAEVPTVVRMASIPHGTTIIAQGLGSDAAGAPAIPKTNILPFSIGAPSNPFHFPEQNLAAPTTFRTPPGQMEGITQAMVDDPNSVLRAALSGQSILKTTTLVVSSGPSPVLGGGVANTAFLQGGPGGPNAQAAIVTATFWIETVKGPPGHPDFLQLQYTQSVMLNFNTLSWPHISVATLRREVPSVA